MTDAGYDQRGLPRGQRVNEDWEVTPREVADAMADRPDSVLLIDVRTPEEHAAARIEGALLVPLAELDRRLEDLDAEGKQVVTHCHHGQRSLKAAAILRQQGIDAKSMAGGIDAWSAAIDPTVPRY